MFREGIHRARIKHKDWEAWLEGIVEYVSDCRIFLYTNTTAFKGTESDNFRKNSFGYKFCFHTSKSWVDDVIYLDYDYIGEL